MGRNVLATRAARSFALGLLTAFSPAPWGVLFHCCYCYLIVSDTMQWESHSICVRNTFVCITDIAPGAMGCSSTRRAASSPGSLEPNRLEDCSASLLLYSLHR